jgi:hypothetical protein
MMKHARWLIPGCLALCLLWSGWAGAQAPTTMAYQGRLLTAAGVPVTTTTSVVFRIYAAASGGSYIWTEITPSITPDANGVFTVLLGSNTALTPSVFDGTTRYLSLQVGGDAEMVQRQALSSVPYAMRAAAAPGGPIAYGIVTAGGQISAAGSGNWTVSWDATNGRYAITISGISYSVWSYLPVVSSFSPGCILSTGSLGGLMLVNPRLHDGSVSQSAFHFLVYSLSSMASKSAPPEVTPDQRIDDTQR